MKTIQYLGHVAEKGEMQAEFALGLIYDSKDIINETYPEEQARVEKVIRDSFQI